MLIAQHAQHPWRPPSTEFNQNCRFWIDADHCGTMRPERYGKLTRAAAEIDDDVVGSEPELLSQCRRLSGGKITPVLRVQLRRCSTEVGLHPASLAHNDSREKGVRAKTNLGSRPWRTR